MTAPACLDETTASQLLQGLLPNNVAAESEQHLLECAECLELVEATSSNDNLLEVLRAPQDSVTHDPAHLSAEVNALVEDLDGLASTANSNASAFAEIKELLEPTDSDQELGKFSRFRVLEILGAGGMGVVLKAIDDRIGRTVALKLMRPSLAKNREAKLRFQREAMAVASFEHEHIVTVYDVDEHRDTPYFTMELLEGESLRDRLRRKEKLPIAEALRITREIAIGLANAHERGQLHRDIKPDNIWLQTPNDHVKILDFGLVHSIDSSGSLTHSGAILGTPEYMAPEQACAEAIDQRCDLFSLGCVLYHMLTGDPPFRGKNVVATLVAIANAVVISPREKDAKIPKQVSDLTMRLLQRDPAQRLESANVLITEVDQLLPQSSATGMRLSSAKRSWLWPLLLCAGIAGIFAGVIAIKTNNGTLYIDTGTNEDVAAMVEGEVVELRDKAGKKTYKLSVGASQLRSGEYEIVVKEKDTGLVFSSRDFHIGRGDHQHIRVWLEDSNFEPAVEKGSKEAIQLRKGRMNKLLVALRDSKARQATTVARLQKLVKTLSKKLDVPVDGVGNPTSTFDPMKKLAETISITEFEIDDLKASIGALDQLLATDETPYAPTEFFDAAEFPTVMKLRREIAVKEEQLGKIEALSVNGKESNAYKTAREKLDALNEELSTETKRARVEKSRLKLESALIDKRQDLTQKERFFRTLLSRRADMQKIFSEETDARLELQFAREELQRALGLYAKISERESEVSATIGLPQDLAEELWGSPAQSSTPPQPAK